MTSSFVLRRVALLTASSSGKVLGRRQPISRDMVSHMKRTVEIADPLLEEARRLVAREGTTVRALIEQGLREVLAERRRAGLFRLRKASFRGSGLQDGAQGLTWDRLRELTCARRGG